MLKNFIFIIFFTSSIALSKIHTINSLKEIYNYISENDEDLYIFFDVHHTLVCLLQFKIDGFRIKIVDEVLKYFNWRTSKVKPLEEGEQALIDSLQKKYTVGALTAAPAYYADNVLNQLKKVGIKFNFLDQASFCLEQSYGFFPRCVIELKEGVIFAADKKPYALKLFFTKYNIRPRKIILVDDLLENLESIEAAYKGSDVEFVGLHILKFC